tara:strand:+ start:1010 stop:1276 length:267 start_codon:yes stop_codon:yes gene_type:complete
MASKKKSQKSLDSWTRQKWRTRDGKPAKRKDKSGRTVTARYLPDAAWKSLSKSEAKATDDKKRRASRRGRGVVANTKRAKSARRSARG